MTTTADTILVLVDRERDRDLLTDRLSVRYRVESPRPSTVHDLPESTALVLVDSRNARRYESTLAEWATGEPVFTPILLFLGESESVDDAAWRFVTDVVRTPVRQREFNARVETLLRHRRATVALREREHELAAQSSRLDRFASVVAHDLRNPLNAASGWLDVARETGDEAAFEKVESAHGRMAALIEDILEFARQGDLVGAEEAVQLAAVAYDAWSDVSTPDATLVVTDAAADAVILADRDRLHELLGNLFRNAIQHAGTDVTVTVGQLDGAPEPADESDATGPSPSVEPARTSPSPSVEPARIGFFVEDDGPGIPEEVRERLFQPGVRGGPGAGTGYGLSIVDTIADAHGWTVAAAPSAPGRGARFEIRGIERPAERPTTGR